MTIAEAIALPIGGVAENIVVEITTAGSQKNEENVWLQNLTVKDYTGSMKAVWVSKNRKPLVRTAQITIIKALRTTDGLWITDTEKDIVIGEPPEYMTDPIRPLSEILKYTHKNYKRRGTEQRKLEQQTEIEKGN